MTKLNCSITHINIQISSSNTALPCLLNLTAIKLLWNQILCLSVSLSIYLYIQCPLDLCYSLMEVIRPGVGVNPSWLGQPQRSPQSLSFSLSIFRPFSCSPQISVSPYISLAPIALIILGQSISLTVKGFENSLRHIELCFDYSFLSIFDLVAGKDEEWKSRLTIFCFIFSSFFYLLVFGGFGY